MAPCVCIGGGGGCNPYSSGTSTQEFLSAFGYTYNPNDPLDLQYNDIATQYQPPALFNTKFSAGFLNHAKACMRSRSLLFCKATPGDCGGTQSVVGKLPSLSSTQVAGQIAGLGIQGGSTIASVLGAGGALLSGVTLGATAALSVILQVFQAHAAAVTAQANSLCTLCPQATTAMQQIDAAVKAGSATPAQGIAAIQTIAKQFKQAILALTKSCNAFCAYDAIMQMQAAISPYIYGVNMQAPAGQSFSPYPTIYHPPVIISGTVSRIATAPQTIAGQPQYVSTNPMSPSNIYYSATTPDALGIAPANAYAQPLLTEASSAGSNPPQVAQPQAASQLFASLPSWLWIAIAALGAWLFFGGSRSEAAA